MTVAPLLALASALCYGLVDVGGGLLARRADPERIAFVAQAGALVLTLLAAAVVPAEAVTAADLAWGGLSGAGTGIGMLFLFRGLARGGFSDVVPLASVGGVVIPVVVGVTLLGDRPSAVAWAGMVLAAPALWLLLGAGRSSDAESPSRGSGDALLASLGIAVQYLALAQADSAAGLWPLTVGRCTALAALAPFVLAGGGSVRLPLGESAAATVTGGGAALALFLYQLAADDGMLTITVVLASLYPVVPVVVGIRLYAEPLSGAKALGLAVAVAAVALLSAG